MRITHSLVAVALSGALALTGCADDSDDNGSSSDETTSESPTTEEPTEEIEETEAAEGDAVDVEDFVSYLESGMDTMTTAGISMEMAVAGQAMTGEGSIDYTTTPPSIAMRISGGTFGGQNVEMRMVDAVMYMNMGELSQGKFIAFDLDELSEMAGLGDFDFSKQMDPNAMFDALEEGITEVTFVGDEDVDGTDARHYRYVVDTGEVSMYDNMPPAVKGSLPDTITSDVWLDDENRMVKMETDMGSLGSMVMKMFDFGEPVDIQKPPASQITRAPAG